MKTIRTSEVKLLEHYNWVPDTIKAFTKLAFLVQTGFLSFKAFQIVSIHRRLPFSNATSEMEQKDYYISSRLY